ncbi:hypothetical protein NDU88_007518 [Pleurodeles waltl]|uniref:Uncharacterized protein n=1 Tax=Pleurodeles waltl TaxID=8319 RepID=A0AAV7VQR1_PLEWA|nr:hypothetical protein NDU88_007518 [Pleurodeles waltl]
MRTLVRSVTWQPETLDAGSCARRSFPEDSCRDATDACKIHEVYYASHGGPESEIQSCLGIIALEFA